MNTGFGALSNTRISPQEIKRLQTNLIASHSSGVGKPLSREIVRALMLLRINTLAKGYSGIRLETLEAIVEMLNKGVYPIIPAKGSVGASGDLAPISHDSGAYWRRQCDVGKGGYGKGWNKTGSAGV